MILKQLKRIFRVVRNLRQFHRRVLSKMPTVVNVGRRALLRKVNICGRKRIKKTFERTKLGMRCCETEMLAHRIFKGRSWMSPLVKRGRRWFAIPYYLEENRLDRAAVGMDESTRFTVAKQAVGIIFEIFLEGYAHCDFHAGNLYWVDGRLILSDFETMQRYPEGDRPAFPLSYDITGQGLASPFSTSNMGYAPESGPHTKCLQYVLGVPVEKVLAELSKELKKELLDASGTFKSKHKSHKCRAGRIYSSFALPYLEVHPNEVQRDSKQRLENFRIHKAELQGKSILDLGCNVGGMLFAMQEMELGMCLGIEYDQSKVTVATKIAAYNGLSNVHFVCADIDKLDVRKVDGPFDVVFCLAIEGHIRKKRRLFHFLADTTRETVYFEGNSTTDVDTVQNLLLNSGFKSLEFLGLSDDDCLPDNNCRPLIIARK